MTSLEDVLHARQQRIDSLHRFEPGRTALLVVDMQHGFLDPGAALEVPQGREIVTGVVTDVCVNATLMSAATRDYRVTAVTDGVATLWPELQEACFQIWKRKFARLRTTAKLVEELSTF
ncbi:MAG: isochorismatase family protein [Planctomycetota bacterium]